MICLRVKFTPLEGLEEKKKKKSGKEGRKEGRGREGGKEGYPSGISLFASLTLPKVPDSSPITISS